MIVGTGQQPAAARLPVTPRAASKGAHVASGVTVGVAVAIVEVGVGHKGSQYRAGVLEVWGSAQRYDEEHGRRKVVARGTDPRDVLAECVARAHAAGIACAGESDGTKYLPQAVSSCEDALEDALARPPSKEEAITAAKAAGLTAADLQ